MRPLLVLSAFTVATIQSISALVRSACINSGDTVVLVTDDFENYRGLTNAGGLKASFLVERDELEKAKEILQFLPKRSVVWKLDKDDLKAAEKHSDSSEQLGKDIKELISVYEEDVDSPLKLVTVPSKTSEKVIKALEDAGIVVIEALRTVSGSEEVNELIKDSKDFNFRSGVLAFKADNNGDVNELIKLNMALNVVTAKNCFWDIEDQSDDEEELSRTVSSSSEIERITSKNVGISVIETAENNSESETEFIGFSNPDNISPTVEIVEEEVDDIPVILKTNSNNSNTRTPDFVDLADKAIEKDEVLGNHVNFGFLATMRKRFNSVTIKMYDAHDDMVKYQEHVLNELKKRSTKDLVLISNAEDAMKNDEELKMLVDCGMWWAISKYFNESITSKSKRFRVVYSTSICQELLKEAKMNKLRLLAGNGPLEKEDGKTLSTILQEVEEELKKQPQITTDNTKTTTKKKNLAFDLDKNSTWEFSTDSDPNEE